MMRSPNGRSKLTVTRARAAGSTVRFTCPATTLQTIPTGPAFPSSTKTSRSDVSPPGPPPACPPALPVGETVIRQWLPPPAHYTSTSAPHLPQRWHARAQLPVDNTVLEPHRLCWPDFDVGDLGWGAAPIFCTVSHALPHRARTHTHTPRHTMRCAFWSIPAHEDGNTHQHCIAGALVSHFSAANVSVRGD